MNDKEHKISPYNFLTEVQGIMQLPKKVIICDCTLREGEQAAEVNLSISQKVQIARRLSEIGIHQIQIGYPGRSSRDRESIKIIKEESSTAKLEGLVQVFQDDWQGQINAGLSSGVDILGMIYPSSSLRLKYVQKVSQNQMIERSIEAVEYAVSQKTNCMIKFAPTDTMRADYNLLSRLFPALERSGVQRVSVADTTGSAHPSAVRYLVKQVVNMVNVPVQVHCHDDFGMATACALAGVEGGASIIDVTINGLGERAGNASLDEVATALSLLYGYDLGIELDQLRPLALDVATMIGVPIPPHKSLVGEYAFAHKLDAHVMGVLANPDVYEAVSPEQVGHQRILPLGKYSGSVAIRAALDSIGLEADEKQIETIVSSIEALGTKQKGVVSLDQFETVAREIIG